jgi:hypothetical protein
LTLDRTSVRSKNPPASPDTVSGTVRAEDPDGLDSVWVSVDLVVAGEDGFLQRTLSAPFRFTVGPGKTATTRIPVTIRARDIAGFEASRDSFVTVVP